MMRNATWTLSNLCRGKPPPPFEWARHLEVRTGTRVSSGVSAGVAGTGHSSEPYLLLRLRGMSQSVYSPAYALEVWKVLTDACWALSYLSDGPNERITAVIQEQRAERAEQKALFFVVSGAASGLMQRSALVRVSPGRRLPSARGAAASA